MLGLVPPPGPRAQRVSEEMRRLPFACLAGPFFMLSLFWVGWTARSSVLWIVPTLAGIPFGIGYLCLFMALLPSPHHPACYYRAPSLLRQVLAELTPGPQFRTMFDEHKRNRPHNQA